MDGTALILLQYNMRYILDLGGENELFSRKTYIANDQFFASLWKISLIEHSRYSLACSGGSLLS